VFTPQTSNYALLLIYIVFFDIVFIILDPFNLNRYWPNSPVLEIYFSITVKYKCNVINVSCNCE